MLTKNKIFPILDKINNLIPQDTLWMVFAGANCFIRGILNKTKDIDIITTEEGLKMFNEQLKNYKITKNRMNKSLNWEGLDFEIDGVNIEVIYDKIECNYTHYTQDLINGLFDMIDGIRFLKPEREMIGYNITNNNEKVEIIHKWLKKIN